ncbi:DUF3071 family protein [Nocardioides albertanoniae]|uniref:DUF3071 family protein n=2 Tax=Nocardioides albertanoniae TaxID=1175486 RepID=A0A543A9G9_9ACTN|nr:DUF3071 family protein [Nocardioides albertanoniae]
MLLVDDDEREYTADIDDRLRAALEAVSTRRSEQTVNKTPSSSLRPRDIQTRIRAGESAEEVAAVAGTTVEKILAFAGPVLAERVHMAQRAQQASVRRKPGEEAPSTARTLGQAVTAHFQGMYIDPETVSWDSYRRPDGRWKLTGEFETADRSGIAELTYDAPGNYVELDNDDARWLTGERLEAPAPEPEPVTDDLLAARRRRAKAPQAPSAPAPAAPPAASAPATPAGPATPPPAAKPARPAKAPKRASAAVDTPLEAFLDEEAPSGKQQPAPAEPEAGPETTEPAAAAPEQPEPAPEEPKPAKKSSSRRKRASVPSWDEIMFGGGKQE